MFHRDDQYLQDYVPNENEEHPYFPILLDETRQMVEEMGLDELLNSLEFPNELPGN